MALWCFMSRFGNMYLSELFMFEGFWYVTDPNHSRFILRPHLHVTFHLKSQNSKASVPSQCRSSQHLKAKLASGIPSRKEFLLLFCPPSSCKTCLNECCCIFLFKSLHTVHLGRVKTAGIPVQNVRLNSLMYFSVLKLPSQKYK